MNVTIFYLRLISHTIHTGCTYERRFEISENPSLLSEAFSSSLPKGVSFNYFRLMLLRFWRLFKIPCTARYAILIYAPSRR